jgi:prepilin-type processing-associated H-X9-DG protein
MKYKVDFSKKDFAIAFACGVFLLMGLGAVGDGSRRRAKEAVCLSNLRQWGTVFQAYTASNNEYFYSGEGPPGFWWVIQLEPCYRTYKQKIWFCPTATKPLYDESGNQTGQWSRFSAWGIYTGRQHPGLSPGIAGSYGLNGYVLNPDSTDYSFEGGRNTKNNWRTPNVEGGNNIPVFADCMRFDAWPLETDSPPPIEDMAWMSNNHIARFCFNRHNGAVNVLFMDWSARKVGLKELWTLKWHRTYNTSGPWTKAGGVQPNNWPQWMRNFKDF